MQVGIVIPPVIFFMDYGRSFGTRGLEKRECNRGVLIRGWICEWIYRLGCCEVQHLCMRWFDLIAFDQIHDGQERYITGHTSLAPWLWMEGVQCMVGFLDGRVLGS